MEGKPLVGEENHIKGVLACDSILEDVEKENKKIGGVILEQVWKTEGVGVELREGGATVCVGSLLCSHQNNGK